MDLSKLYIGSKLISKRCTEKYLKSVNLWNDLFQETSFLSHEYSLAERIYVLSHVWKAEPQCLT